MSSSVLDSALPPQSGRSPANLEEETRGLWPQLLAAFRDLSGSFDPFANDADPRVRALGRNARLRRTQAADDYFAIGDLCARLTFREDTVSQTYAAKTVAAYARVREVSPTETVAASAALLNFAHWISNLAHQLDRYEALTAAVLVCERALRLNVFPEDSSDNRYLQQEVRVLRDRLNQLLDDGREQAESRQVTNARESRSLCDRAQMALRQSQPAEALVALDDALRLDPQNQQAWLWRAMALTDLGRFDDALESYDRALNLDSRIAGVWNSKGALLLELGRLEQALACFDRALILANHVSTIQALYLLNKGKALYMLGRYREARSALSESHTLEPNPESAAGIAACDSILQSVVETLP